MTCIYQLLFLIISLDIDDVNVRVSKFYIHTICIIMFLYIALNNIKRVNTLYFIKYWKRTYCKIKKQTYKTIYESLKMKNLILKYVFINKTENNLIGLGFLFYN